MDILFLGGLYDDEETVFKNSKNYFQNAANKLQWSIVYGIEENLNITINLLNSIYIGSFPHQYKTLVIKSYNWKHKVGANDRNVGFINLWGLKSIIKSIKITKEIKKWSKKDTNNVKVLISYSLHSPNIYAIKAAKKNNPYIHVCKIITDLPEYMRLDEKTNLIYSFFKKFDMGFIKKNMKYIDSYVLLTKQMGPKLGINNDKYTVVEGIYENRFADFAQERNTNIKTIVYTGTLNWKYGIRELVESFLDINKPNYILKICGVGEAEEYLRSISHDNERILFLGLQNSQTVRSIQQNATILVNPRRDDNQYTKYSFPSKVLEYLSSGRPMIGYKLAGIPDDYDHFIHYIDPHDGKGLKNKILEICEKSDEELIDFGLKAKKYVQENKNREKQTQKIIEVIKRNSQWKW